MGALPILDVVGNLVFKKITHILQKALANIFREKNHPICKEVVINVCKVVKVRIKG